MTNSNSPILIRKATKSDAPDILSLVDALAEYEKLTPPDSAAKDRLTKDMSGAHPRFDAFLADLNGRAVGYAFVFETYSSFLALPTLYLEDLFVLPEFRKRKIGYTLFRSMVKEAFRRGCGRMEWTVLDWNRVAIDFYDHLGSTHMKQWQLYRLVREEMEKVMEG